MPSQESELLVKNFTEIKNSMQAHPELGISWTRLLLETLHEPAAEPTDVCYEEVKCAGTVRPAIWAKPISASPKHVILYAHGGGGFGGSPSSHRKWVGHLAKSAGCYALLLDYRLAPEHPFPEGQEDVLAGFNWLVDQGYPARNIILAGDSAGGAIAIATALRLKDAGKTQAAAVAAFSPWLDMEAKGESLKTNEGKDAIASAAALSMSTGYLLGAASPQDPFANPLYADFKDFPPLYVTAGTSELLQSDTEAVAKKATAAGVQVKVKLAEGMQHCYIFLAGRAPEADETVAEAGKWCKEKFGI